ncbi:hypothetical protein [Mesorhizobium sp. CA4]|uniref:hypothetical protein n=1 Tax=Mesorhizobium sp. CA4 TaxID=588499 RepID=UPI00398D3438
MGPPEAGKKLVIIGDTESTDALAEHVRGADLLVIEATFPDEMRPWRATMVISRLRRQHLW